MFSIAVIIFHYASQKFEAHDLSQRSRGGKSSIPPSGRGRLRDLKGRIGGRAFYAQSFHTILGESQLKGW